MIDRDGRAVHFGQWLPDHEASNYFDVLRDTLRWEQNLISMYGKTVPIPRLNAWYGDAGSRYQYSGASFTPFPWTPELFALKQQLERFSHCRFNSVLANLYRDGNDSVAWHSDDEPELGPEPAIASVSLGQTRRFTLKHKRDKQQVALDLAHGDLLLMTGALQKNWVHQLAKTRSAHRPRINLTFRWVYPKS
ncbi:alpha-ketoglutarate-dependent dioxygenase AlkB [Gilvimarinus sp. DA14]|uniref:alpha-ketoglutarate-dependent dioxygenase AlkB family protein n=1 Tax=Gilvimarinus sp. DA14 TaxID=2956798 RepID=UPI0020B6A158|nr:alpha-ketoglutarate-dependent dioxygenase AlkB [Gilvimarinus sp. DA14]UTF60913.1 alpha-ketoglutarate-dependent dioxygenase AlkB [Gilvimarinus sp. DA14]